MNGRMDFTEVANLARTRAISLINNMKLVKVEIIIKGQEMIQFPQRA